LSDPYQVNVEDVKSGKLARSQKSAGVERQTATAGHGSKIFGGTLFYY